MKTTVVFSAVSKGFSEIYIFRIPGTKPISPRQKKINSRSVRFVASEVN